MHRVARIGFVNVAALLGMGIIMMDDDVGGKDLLLIVEVWTDFGIDRGRHM